MEQIKKGFACKSCGDSMHTCTAWNGESKCYGVNDYRNEPNLNPDCPAKKNQDVTQCPFRITNTPSKWQKET
jgi:hypothetical protein